jgi:hypothetical protein
VHEAGPLQDGVGLSGICFLYVVYDCVGNIKICGETVFEMG